MTKAIAIIPARYASKRFPGKPLIEIAGKTMLKRVFDQVNKFKQLEAIVIATENQEIFEHASTFCDHVFMTNEAHQSGTDRCLEAVQLYSEAQSSKPNVVLNIQCDEPFIHPSQIALLYHLFDNETTQISTIIKKIEKSKELHDSNKVKAIVDLNGNALYFSRQAIPFVRDVHSKNWLENHTFYKHLGLYGYRTSVLEALGNLKTSALENAEKLEQLRWMENGFTIRTAVTERESYSIDTPEDLENLNI